MMDYLNITDEAVEQWEALCRRMSRSHKNEHDLEVRFEDCLSFIFYWQDKCIKCQERTHAKDKMKKITDILLTDDIGEPLIIVEMKSQKVRITNEERRQLFDYMKHYGVKFGFLVNRKISLYYDDGKSSEPLRVLTLSFKDKNNSDGARLSYRLDRSMFSPDLLEQFCIEYLEEREQTEREYSVSSIGNIENFRNPDTSKNERFRTLIALYKDWLNDPNTTEDEKAFVPNIQKSMDLIKENVFGCKLEELSDVEYIEKIKILNRHIPSQTHLRRFYGSNEKILELRKNGFDKAISHLNKIDESDQFKVLCDFIGESEFKVKGIDKSTWSELIRIKFPDVPLVNEITEKFFDTIDYFIGDEDDEKAKHISDFYKRFSDTGMNLYAFSHLEHFAVGQDVKNNEKGQEFIDRYFANKELYDSAERMLDRVENR